MTDSQPQDRTIAVPKYFYDLMRHGKSVDHQGLVIVNMVHPLNVFDTKEAVIETFNKPGLTPHDLAQWKDDNAVEKYAVVIGSCEEPSEESGWIPVFTSVLNDISEDVLFDIFLKATLQSVADELELIAAFAFTTGSEQQRFQYVMTGFAHFNDLLVHNRHSTEARFPLFHPNHATPIPKGLHRIIANEVIKGYQSVEEWYCDKVSSLIGESQTQDLIEILKQVNDVVTKK